MKIFFKLFMSYVIFTAACNIGTVSVYAESNNIDSTETTEIFTEEPQVTETEVTDKAETSDNEVYANGEEVQPAAERDGTEELQAAGTETLDNEVYEDDGEIQLAAAVTVEGEGTEESPYIITNEQQLFTMAMGNEKFPLDAYYVLNNDISFKSKNWTPIGLNSTTEEKGFTGNFDGKGHKISNLNISASSGSNYGLFYSNAGTISNLTVEAGTISGGSTSGIIAATNSGTITDCIVSGSIRATAGYAGGIAGSNSGTITKCRSSYTFTNTKSSENKGYIGGITGNSTGTVSDCIFTGTLKNTFSKYLGGIAGYSEGDITNCDCSAFIEGGSVHYAGGIVGYSGGNVTNCDFTGAMKTVEAPGYGSNDYGIGGIAGYVKGNISNCSNTNESITITGACYAGGIAGYIGGNISDCNNTNESITITGACYAGGIAGYVGTDASDCINASKAITVESDYYIDYVGGITGYVGGSVSNCINNSSINAVLNVSIKTRNYTHSNGKVYTDITVDNNGEYFKYYHGRSTYTKNKPNINSYIGGIAGYALGSIMGCSNNNSIKGNSVYMGGIAGYTNYNVKLCFNKGNIQNNFEAKRYSCRVLSYSEWWGDGESGYTLNKNDSYRYIELYFSPKTGGLIGYNKGYLVDDCYSIGNVKCESGYGSQYDYDSKSYINYYNYASGLIGHNDSRGKTTNCYCTGTVTGGSNYVYLDPFSTKGNYINCFYDKTINKEESVSAYGFTTTEMKDKSAVEDNYLFWDFDEVWGIDSKINSGYPYLLSSVTKMKLSETNMQLVVGDSRKIVPLNPGLSNIKWSSSDDGIASVDSEGNVTANGVGSAVITASVNDGLYTADCTVLVVTEDDLENSAVFIVDSVTEALPGEKISVPVRLTKNSKGICSMGVDISYDKSILKFAALKEGDLFDNTTSNTNYGDNIVRIASSSSSNITGVGVLCYLEFEVAEDAQKGSTELNIKVDELKTLVGVNQTNLPYTTTNGTVIIDEFCMLGDVDNNGVISPSDATEVLLYYINAKDFNLKQKKAADMNKDNEITPIDAAFILKKYVDPSFEI